MKGVHAEEREKANAGLICQIEESCLLVCHSYLPEKRISRCGTLGAAWGSLAAWDLPS